MPLVPYLHHRPRVHADVTMAPDAYVVGKVEIAGPAHLESSAVLRADQSAIRVAGRFHIGQRSTVHVEPDHPTEIGLNVWVGSDAVVHASVLEDGVRLEDGALVLSGARIGKGSIVAAGSLVPEGAQIPDNSYVSGVPARRSRDTTPEEREKTRLLVAESLTVVA